MQSVNHVLAVFDDTMQFGLMSLSLTAIKGLTLLNTTYRAKIVPIIVPIVKMIWINLQRVKKIRSLINTAMTS